MKAFVCILKDRKGRFYIGSTIDTRRRLRQHRGGFTATTNRMDHLLIVLVQEYANILEARTVERRIKRLKRKDYIENMVRDGHIRIK